MLPYTIYLLKVSICSGILFGYYWLLLRNKIFHQYNRFYLLAAVVVSLSFPLMQVNIPHNANMPAPQSIKLLQAVSSSNEYLDEIIITTRQTNFSSAQALLLFYCITSLVLFTFFIHTLIKIRQLFTRHQHRFVENVFFVNTMARGTPFSF